MVDYEKLAHDIIEEINLARQVPNAFVAGLVGRLEHFNGMMYEYPGQVPLETYEGDKAVNEAIEFMKNQESIPVMVHHKELSVAAQSHAEELSQTTEPSHVGANSMTPAQRISKTCKWAKVAAECIDVASTTANDVVCSMIIDDGNEERSNRKVIFSKNIRLMGVSCAPHPTYGVVTVLNFAGGEYDEAGENTVLIDTTH